MCWLSTNTLDGQTDQPCHDYALLDLRQNKVNTNHLRLYCGMTGLNTWHSRALFFNSWPGLPERLVQQNNDSPVCNLLPQLWSISWCFASGKPTQVTIKASEFELGIISVHVCSRKVKTNSSLSRQWCYLKKKSKIVKYNFYCYKNPANNDSGKNISSYKTCCVTSILTDAIKSNLPFRNE